MYWCFCTRSAAIFSSSWFMCIFPLSSVRCFWQRTVYLTIPIYLDVPRSPIKTHIFIRQRFCTKFRCSDNWHIWNEKEGEKGKKIYTSSAFPLVLPSDISKHNVFEKHCFKPKSTEIQNQWITYTKLIITLALSEKCAVVVLSKEQPWNCSRLSEFSCDQISWVLHQIVSNSSFGLSLELKDFCIIM